MKPRWRGLTIVFMLGIVGCVLDNADKLGAAVRKVDDILINLFT